MQVGVRAPQSSTTSATSLRDFAQAAEAVGFDSLWVVEHIMTPLRDGSGSVLPAAYESLLQPLETLSFLAAVTSKILLGTSILVTALHRPLPLARKLSTIDVLSNGRVICGLGLGYVPEEFAQMDTPWERRGDRMSEFIEAFNVSLGPDPVAFQGTFFSIPACVSGPKPLQRDADGMPTLPVVIAGGTAQSVMRRIAQHGDGWIPTVDIGSDPEVVVAHAEQLRRMARAHQRSGVIDAYLRGYLDLSWLGAEPNPIVPPALLWSGRPAELLERLQRAQDAGIDHVILDLSQNFRDGVPFVPTSDTLAAVASVVTDLRPK